MTTPARPAAGANRGLSLIEALTVIGIMVIMIVVVDQIFSANYDLLTRQLVRIENDNGATLAIRRIGELVRGATTVVASGDVNGTTYASDASTLVLQMPSLDANGNIIAAQYDHIAVYRDTTVTEKIMTDTETGTGSVRASGQHPLTDNNQVLTFSYDAASPEEAARVSVFLVNAKTVRGAEIESKAWTASYLRNR